MKFRRMTQQISQLKEETFSKDNAISEENQKQKQYPAKTSSLTLDI
jgi:chromosome segregation ATPase